MAYTKQTWVNNKSHLNATRMNHIEDGIYNIDKTVNGITEDVDNLNQTMTNVEESIEDLGSSILDSALPDASSVSDGAALISIDGIWVPQYGYGYYTDEETSEDPINIINSTQIDFVGNLNADIEIDLACNLSDIKDGMVAIFYFDNVAWFSGGIATDTFNDVGTAFTFPILQLVKSSVIAPRIIKSDGTKLIIPAGFPQYVLKSYPCLNGTVNMYVTANTTISNVYKMDEELIGVSAEKSNNSGEIYNQTIYGGNDKYAKYITGSGTHTEGYYSRALGEYSHAEGNNTSTLGESSHSEGVYTHSKTKGSHSEGMGSLASGLTSHAEGHYTTASGSISHAEGNFTVASGDSSHAEGYYTKTTGIGSHSEGRSSKALGDYSHAEGSFTQATEADSHAEGSYSQATNKYSHAEGDSSIASGECSHAEGKLTKSEGNYSHSEGHNTTASGTSSHAEGYESVASGASSHSEGFSTYAMSDYAHSEGRSTRAASKYSHSEGIGTKASSEAGHAQGKYNIEDTEGIYADIVGNGTSQKKSNAYTLDWSGNGWYQGTVEGTAFILPSSTEGSTKRFKITVDDSGTLTATEIVE